MARGVKKAVRGRRQFFEKPCRSDLGKFFPNRARWFGSAESLPDRAQLDGVDEAVLGNDVRDDDDFIAGSDVTEAAQGEDGVLDGDVGLGGERQEVRLDRTKQAELAQEREVGGEGENRRMDGAQCGEPVGHESVARKREQLRARDLVGENDGGVQHLHALGGEDGGFAEGGGCLALDAAGDFVEHLHAIERVFSDGGFA